MKDELWARFLEWLYKAHQITKDWSPNRISIEIWEEFRKKNDI